MNATPPAAPADPSAAPAPSAAPPTSPPPYAAAPPAPRRMGMGVVIAVVVVVVLIIAVVAGLYVGKVGPFASSSPSGGTSAGTPFSQAASSASSAASGQSGGPWTVVGGAGFNAPGSTTQNTSFSSSSFSGTGCVYTALSGAPSTVTLSGSSSAGASGDGTGWVVYLSGASSWLFVLVTGSSATPLATLGGSGCEFFTTGLTVSLPSGYIDSPAAAQAAYNDGGSAYAKNHTKVDVEYSLTPAIEDDGFGSSAQWTVEITNCNIIGTTGTTLDGLTGSEFSVKVNATSGAASDPTTQALTCPTSTSS